jgi:hypothetical protein
VRRYYAAIDRRDFETAWARLSPALQTSMGGLQQWRAGYKTSVETTVTSVSATHVGATKASVRVALKAVDLDACGDRVTQRFAGTWTLTKSAGRWMATGLRIDKTAGRTPKTSIADCGPDQSSPQADDSPAVPEQPNTECDPNYGQRAWIRTPATMTARVTAETDPNTPAASRWSVTTGSGWTPMATAWAASWRARGETVALEAEQHPHRAVGRGREAAGDARGKHLGQSGVERQPTALGQLQHGDADEHLHDAAGAEAIAGTHRFGRRHPAETGGARPAAELRALHVQDRSRGVRARIAKRVAQRPLQPTREVGSNRGPMRCHRASAAFWARRPHLTPCSRNPT